MRAAALTTVLWYRMLQEDEVGSLSLWFFLIPVLGLALAVALFGETIGLLEALGMAATLAALIVVAAGALRQERRRAPGCDEWARFG